MIRVAVESFQGSAPRDHLLDLGAGQEAQHGYLLAAPARNLQGPAVDCGPDDLAEVATPDHRRGLLHLAHRPLEIATGVDHSARLARLHHAVGVREDGGDGLVGRDALHPSLSAGDHRVPVVLGGRDDRDEVRHLVPEQRLVVRVESLDAEALPDRRPALWIVLGYGDYLGVGIGRVGLGVVLPHPSAPDDGNPMDVVGHVCSLWVNSFCSSWPMFTRKKVYSSATS